MAMGAPRMARPPLPQSRLERSPPLPLPQSAEDLPSFAPRSFELDIRVSFFRPSWTGRSSLGSSMRPSKVPQGMALNGSHHVGVLGGIPPPDGVAAPKRRTIHSFEGVRATVSANAFPATANDRGGSRARGGLAVARRGPRRRHNPAREAPVEARSGRDRPARPAAAAGLGAHLRHERQD